MAYESCGIVFNEIFKAARVGDLDKIRQVKLHPPDIPTVLHNRVYHCKYYQNKGKEKNFVFNPVAFSFEMHTIQARVVC